MGIDQAHHSQENLLHDKVTASARRQGKAEGEPARLYAPDIVPSAAGEFQNPLRDAGTLEGDLHRHIPFLVAVEE